MRFLLLLLSLVLQLNISGFANHNPQEIYAIKTLTSEILDCGGRSYELFRYYDPTIGNYISQDPIGLAGGNPTLYGYVYNPNNEIDIFGLDCKIKNKKTSYHGTSRRDAFRQAKRDAGIPVSQQPMRAVQHVKLYDGTGTPIIGKDGKLVYAREYHFTNTKGEHIVIQEHSIGHPKASPNDPGPSPHFNVRPIDNTRTGHVKGTHGHYNF